MSSIDLNVFTNLWHRFKKRGKWHFVINGNNDEHETLCNLYFKPKPSFLYRIMVDNKIIQYFFHYRDKKRRIEYYKTSLIRPDFNENIQGNYCTECLCKITETEKEKSLSAWKLCKDSLEQSL